MQLRVTVYGTERSGPKKYTVNGMEVLDQIARAVALEVKETLRTLPIRRLPHKRSVMIEAQWVERGGGAKE